MAEPANRHDQAGGGKFYRHPQTGELFDSVTTVLDVFDKGNLKHWAGMVAADEAFELLPQMVASVIEPNCENTYNRCYEKHGRQATCERCPCGRCQRCLYRRISMRHSYESRRRADEGSEVHDAIRLYSLTGEIATLRDEVKPYFEQFLTWVQEFDLYPNSAQNGSWEQTEATLLNREFMYAGTSDAAVWLRRGTPAGDEILDRLRMESALIRVDYKTREKPDERLYVDMPLQGVAYERCETAMMDDGTEFPAPKTAARAVLQLRPDSYSFKPMLTDDSAFDAFRGILAGYRWVQEFGKVAFDLGAALPVTIEQATENIRAVMDAEVVPDTLQAQAPVNISDWDDPWAAPQATPEPPPPQPAELLIPTPPLRPVAQLPKPAKRAPAKKAAKSATATKDPFALANDGGPTLASMKAGGAGPLQRQLLDEDIPF